MVLCEAVVAAKKGSVARQLACCIVKSEGLLLQILGQATDPAVIQAHLKKLFAGVHEVDLTDSKTQVTAVLSIEGEKVQLSKSVTVTSQVETWLQNLLTGLQATLQVRCETYCVPMGIC